MRRHVPPSASVASANRETYDRLNASTYVDGAPHVKHERLRALFRSLAVEACAATTGAAHAPRVLDLGAGNGAATLPFLDLGAHVVAVDVSAHQLRELARQAEGRRGRLDIHCEDAVSFLQRPHRFDIVVACSMLHHIPDYLSVVRRSAAALDGSRGVFLSFQDLCRYDSLPAWSRVLCVVAYGSWRVRGGDLAGGLGRLVRRAAGVYRDDCQADNVEYHLVRKGVDQDAIAATLTAAGFQTRVVPYFSTQSPAWQRLGERIGAVNTFAVVARR